MPSKAAMELAAKVAARPLGVLGTDTDIAAQGLAALLDEHSRDLVEALEWLLDEDLVCDASYTAAHAALARHRPEGA